MEMKLRQTGGLLVSRTRRAGSAVARAAWKPIKCARSACFCFFSFHLNVPQITTTRKARFLTLETFSVSKLKLPLSNNEATHTDAHQSRLQ